MSKKKANVAYANPEPPSFLKKLRAEHGLKSRAEQQQEDLQAKHRVALTEGVEDDEIRPEDAPQIVVLKKGDLTREQVDAALASGKQVTGAMKDYFQQPSKKTRADDGSAAAAAQDAGEETEELPRKKKAEGLSFSSSKKTKGKSGAQAGPDKAKAAKGPQSKKLSKKNAALLSFGEDEEEEES